MGRNAAGVKGASLAPGDRVVAMDVVRADSSLLTVSENGFGKRSLTEDYRLVHRGAKGVSTMKVTDRTGPVVGVVQIVNEGEEVMIVTNGGKMIRIAVADIRVMGRNTQGVRLVKLGADQTEQVVSVAMVADQDPATAEALGDDEGDDTIDLEPSESSDGTTGESDSGDAPDDVSTDDTEE